MTQKGVGYPCKAPGCGALIPPDKSRCPKCRTYASFGPSESGDEEVVRLSDARLSVIERVQTGMLDRVFGGGLAVTSTNLVAGPPGAGKTTLFLQLADMIAEVRNRDVLYVANEQHPSEIKTTAQRIRVKNMDRILVVNAMGGLRSDVGALILQHRPGLMILDSLTQLTEDENERLRICDVLKGYTMEIRAPSLIVNQINKEGDQAGVMKLQHKVDATFFLERDDDTGERMFASTKNRFGEAPVHVFLEMTPADSEIPGKLILKESDGEDEEDS